MIAYNAPECAAPEAEHLLRRALKKHFKTDAWGRRFVHYDTAFFGKSRLSLRSAYARLRACPRVCTRLIRARVDVQAVSVLQCCTLHTLSALSAYK